MLDGLNNKFLNALIDFLLNDYKLIILKLCL